MASSSSIRNPCSNEKCRNVMDVPKSGWKRNDHEVELCYQCFIAFTTKQFCNIYHKNLGVWSMCRSCNKKVHLECEVSQDSYTKLQDGEVICNDCGTPPDVILISGSNETIVNSASSPSPNATVPTTLVINDQLTDQENVLDTHNEELTPKPLPIEYNGDNVYTETTPQVLPLNRKPKIGSGRKNKQYCPRMTEQEQKEISTRFHVKVKPLFEKRLTASDVGSTGRLVIPKQCAEDYFPVINDSKGKCLVILDTDTTEWKFNFKFWSNTKTRIYFLEGFDEFVKSVKLCQDDEVTFSRLEGDGKLVIGYRKRPSTFLSSQVDLLHNTTTASTSTKKTKRGGVTSIKKNEIPTGNNASANTEPNACLSGKSDVSGAEVHLCSKRRKRDIGSTSKSNKNRIMLSDVLAEVRETIQSPDGSNIPSFVLNKSDKKGAPKRKTTSDVLSIFCQQNTDELVVASPEQVASPEVVVGTLIENVDAFSIHSMRNNTYEIGSCSKSTKNVNERSKGKDDGKLVVSPEVVERGAPIAVATEVTPIENVVTLPNATKKHPRHQRDCLCIVCVQPASGFKHHISCDCKACVTLRLRGKKHSQKPPQRVASRRRRKGLPKPTLLIQSSNASPPTTPNIAQPGTSNHIHQTTVSRVSENNGDTNLSNMDSKILPFDLNFPPADFNGDS